MRLDVSRCGRYCISRCLHLSPACLFKEGPARRWALPKKKKEVEVIYFPRQASAVRKPHGHVVQGTAREGNKQLWRSDSEPVPEVGKESRPVRG